MPVVAILQGMRQILRELRFRAESAWGAHDLHTKIAEGERRVVRLTEQINALRLELTHSKANGVSPENIVWVFGTARTGSTWMAGMLCHRTGCRMWREPFIGLLFGHLLYERANSWQPDSEQFVLGQPKEKWLPHVRRMALDGATAATSLGPAGHVIVKEPNGSIGAPILMEAVPENRMVVMLRDPRDVVASTLDAEFGGWIDPASNRERPDPKQADTIARQRAKKYLNYVSKALDAYDTHDGSKALVYYENLRYQTSEVLTTAVKELGLPHSAEEIEGAVKATDWENMAEDRKGSGKFHRKATPGGWTEDLTSKQVEIVEEIAAPLMDRLGYDRVT